MYFYNWNPSVYALDTTHLNNEQDICYRRMIDMYMVSEAPLEGSFSHLAWLLRVDEETVETILNAFFVKDGESWRHKYCDEEIAAYHKKSEQARESGALGGKKSAAKRKKRKPAKQPPSDHEPPLEGASSDPEATVNLTKNQELRTKEERERDAGAGAFVSLPEVVAYAKTILATEECAEFYWNEMESVGWVNRYQTPLSDWKSHFRNYATRWKGNESRQRKGTQPPKPSDQSDVTGDAMKKL